MTIKEMLDQIVLIEANHSGITIDINIFNLAEKCLKEYKLNLVRIIKTLEWMITDMKYRHDDLKGNLEKDSSSDYSFELKEAIELLEELKKEND